jgi:hypothetical protein
VDAGARDRAKCMKFAAGADMATPCSAAPRMFCGAFDERGELIRCEGFPCPGRSGHGVGSRGERNQGGYVEKETCAPRVELTRTLREPGSVGGSSRSGIPIAPVGGGRDPMWGFGGGREAEMLGMPEPPVACLEPCAPGMGMRPDRGPIGMGREPPGTAIAVGAGCPSASPGEASAVR